MYGVFDQSFDHGQKIYMTAYWCCINPCCLVRYGTVPPILYGTVGTENFGPVELQRKAESS
jgi:hypothetical protein